MAPPPPFSICGITALAAAIDRAEIELERGLELLLRELDRPAHMGDADIVVQDVDAAEMRAIVGDAGIDRGLAGDVGGERRAPCRLRRR